MYGQPDGDASDQALALVWRRRVGARQGRLGWPTTRQSAARGPVLRSLPGLGLLCRGRRRPDLGGGSLRMALPTHPRRRRVQRYHVWLRVRQSDGWPGVTEPVAVSGLAITRERHL